MSLSEMLERERRARRRRNLAIVAAAIAALAIAFFVGRASAEDLEWFLLDTAVGSIRAEADALGVEPLFRRAYRDLPREGRVGRRRSACRCFDRGVLGMAATPKSTPGCAWLTALGRAVGPLDDVAACAGREVR